MYAFASIHSVQFPQNIIAAIFYAFSSVLVYFIIAALAVTPRTHSLRIALWPIVTSLAWHAVVSVDMSLGKHNLRFRNTLFTFSMLFIVTRTFDWILAKAPLMRHQPPANSRQSTLMNTLDLALTLRGYGWDWARKVYFPRETRPANSRGFACHVFLSGIGHALLCGIFHTAIRSFSSTGLGSLSGGSIFDHTLPFHVQYVRASIISACSAIEIYTFIQTCYDACTLVGVLVLGHDPVQWPPAFDAPWRATSLVDFWGRRWHQFFRRMFLVQGGYPLSLVLGRAGLVIGAFLSSGMLHHIAVMTLSHEMGSYQIIVGFVMMAPGILAEEVLRRWTGCKVGGVLGWMWTMMWLCLWGNLIVDGFARAGMFGGHLSFTENVVPQVWRAAVERLATSFNGWLSTL